MNAVVDRIVQYANRYQLTDVSTGKVLGVFDFDEVTGTVQQVGTEIDKELFDSIADDLATRLVANGGDSKDLIVTFTAATSVENISSKEKHSTIFGKIAKWFTDRISKLKKFTYDSTTKITSTDIDSTIPTTDALENGDITVMNAEYTNSASRAIADKNGKDITTYVATETDPTVPGWAKNATKPTYTKAEVGLGKVDNTADLDKPISTATQNALSAKVDKVSGKGLSTNDYTTAEKNKLAGLASDTVRYGEQTLTEAQKSQARTNIGAGTSNFDGSWNSLSGKPSFAPVATSGSYNDLSNKPTIPTNYVTTNTAQSISAIKTFTENLWFSKSDMDISKASSTNKYSYIAFDDANTLRAGVLGGMQTTDNYCGTYLQARNGQQIRILSNADGTITETHAPTPPDTDSSTQLATTEWVRRFANPAYLRGTDSNTTYKGYYKIAEATLNEWYRTSVARIFVQDVDSTENGVLNVSVYAGGDGKTSPTSVTTVNMGFLEGINPNAYFGDFFVVVRKKSLTVRGSMKIELWYRQPNEWGRISFSFLTDIPDSRNVSVTNKWTKFSRTSAQERAYISKNVVDLDNGFIPYDSFNESAFTTEDYPVAEIYDNSTNQAQFSAGALRIANSEYARSDKPTTASKRNIIFTDKNNASIATIQSSVGSTWNGLNFLLTNKSGGGNSIEFVHDTNRSVWRFNPTSSSLPIELGEPNRPWNNAYIKNIVADSVTADNLPFTSDGLSTGTLGATTKLASGRYYIERDITINNNTTHIAVVVEGTGNYVYVPARTSTAMNFIGVSLISSGTNLVSVSMTLHDSSGSIVDNTTVTAGTYKYKLLD